VVGYLISLIYLPPHPADAAGQRVVCLRRTFNLLFWVKRTAEEQSSLVFSGAGNLIVQQPKPGGG
jgi:hypothetical protein